MSQTGGTCFRKVGRQNQKLIATGRRLKRNFALLVGLKGRVFQFGFFDQGLQAEGDGGGKIQSMRLSECFRLADEIRSEGDTDS